MRLSDKIAIRLEMLRDVYGQPWVLAPLGLLSFLWALAQFYDFALAQLVPENWAKRAPRIFDMIGDLAGLLPAWAWGTFFMLVLAGAAIEYAVRVSPKFASLRQGPLQLIFEAKEPWVKDIPTARTPPKGNTDPHLPEKQWVTTRSRWFKVLPKNQRQSRVIRGVKVFLADVQILDSQEFKGCGFGTHRQLRWANDAATAFDPRDIHHLENHYIDTISVDAEHNKVFVKWPANPQWITYEQLFDEPGIYRLSIIATSADGDGATTDLDLLWTGKWDQTEMWLADKSASAAKARTRLWVLYRDGVKLRNTGARLDGNEYMAWLEQYAAWRREVLSFAGALSDDLRNHLQTMNLMPDRHGKREPNIASEILDRLNAYLTKDLRGESGL